MHLVWNGHPEGGFIGLGISPSSVAETSEEAAKRAFVYGCAIASRISSVLPSSTIEPRYITAMRSAIYETTFKSWEMKR